MIKTGDWDWGLGFGIGIRTWIGDWGWEYNDSIMPGATTNTHHPPITFNHEGVLCEKSAFSKNVLG